MSDTSSKCFDYLPGALIEIDIHSQTITYMSKMAFSLFGYSRNDVEAGIPVRAIFHEEDEYKRAVEITESFAGNSYRKSTAYQPQEEQKLYDFKLTNKAGEEFLGECQGAIVLDDSGLPKAVRVYIRDLTGQRLTESSLKESEAKYRLLFEKSKDAILILENRIFMDCNQATIDMLRYNNKAELLTTHPSQLSPEFQPDGRPSAEKAEEMMNLAVEHGSHRFEWAHLKSDGTVFTVEVLLTTISSDPIHELIYTVWRDITEHKQAEEALRTEKEFTETALNNQQDTFFLFEPASGKAIRWNRAFSRISGYSDEEIAQLKAPEAYYSPEDLELASSAMEEVISTGTDTVVLNLICKDGRKVPTEYSVTSLKSDKSGRQYFISIGRDITMRQRVEQALEKRIIALTQPMEDPTGIAFDEMFNLTDIQRLQDEFAEATGVASIITDINGTPITKPSNFCRLCSDIVRQTEKGLANCYKSDAALGALNPEGPTIQQCMSGGLWDAGTSITVDGKHIANWLIGQVRDETQTEENMRAYAREIGADEELTAEAFHEVPAMSKEQFANITQFLSTLAEQLSNSAYQNVQQARFIAERKQIDAEQLQLQKQLHQAQKLEAVGTMVGGISHELNNILQSMFLYGELILEQLTDETLLQSMNQLMADGSRARDIVKQILTFSRKTKINMQPREIHNIVLDVVDLERATLPSNIEIKSDIDLNCGPVLCDSTQIHQIMINLCNNAYHAMGETGGLLSISLQQIEASESNSFSSSSYLELCISDTGHGMTAKVSDKIFDPFYTTKGIGEGTGLGLSVIHGIVEMMQGSITVSSELEKGTTFRILLPLADSMEERPERQDEKPLLSSSMSILLVDDEESILKTAEKILSGKGHEVETVSQAQQALEIYKQNANKYDLLITDLTMPGMSGEELVVALRKLDNKLPIIMSTGQLGIEDEHRYSNIGVSGFIQKPWTARELIQLIAELNIN